MVPASNFEAHAKKLLEADQTPQGRLTLAIEVRDSIEIVHTSEYGNFLKYYFRVFCGVLTNLSTPQFQDNVEHKLRNVVLEILNRLPLNEAFRPHSIELLKLATSVLESDNEDNGLICLRIIFDLHKNYRQQLETEVQCFLEFVKTKVYQNFNATVAHFFIGDGSSDMGQASGGQAQMAPSVGGLGGGPMPQRVNNLNPAVRSFKVVTECPLIIMFLFQVYSSYVQQNIPILLPLMVHTIGHQGPVNGPANVPPHLKQAYADMKAAQVKTVSFLTYLLRSFAECIREFEENISKSIVHLLVTCPDSVAIRKELLVATRHVLATDFRKGFFAHINTLLDERVLIGSGRACYETLRPLAYSLLAELIHHVRLELSIPQLSRIVYLFSRNVHDTSLPLSVQMTCVRLMLNLVETIFSRRVDLDAREEGRVLLGRVLDSFVSKFASLKKSIPQAALILQNPPEPNRELQDCKQLVKTLVMSMKALIWSINNFSAVPGQPLVRGMLEDEVRLASGVMKHGLPCLALFKEKDDEVYTHFAAIFTGVEPRNSMDMFSIGMPTLFDAVNKDNHLMQVYTALLQTPKVHRQFSEILIHYLVNSKLDVLKQAETSQAKLVLTLFKHLLQAVGRMSNEGDKVLLPYIPTVVETCLKNAQELERPIGYLQLLRIVFRSLGGNKYDLLYRDFASQSLLQSSINTILMMLEGPSGAEHKDLLVELALTLPVRLSALLQYLPRLMGPLVHALKGPDELVGLGLRTFECWVDSLNPEFLEPSMQGVTSELILTLWGHLRPKPYPYGTKALVLLGKLGGRNRRFLKEPLELECKENPEHGLRLILTFVPGTSFLVPLDRCIHLARAAVMSPNPIMEPYYRRHALKFLRVCLASVLNLRGNVGAEGVGANQLSGMLLSCIDPNLRRSEGTAMKVDLGVKTKTQLMAERCIFKQLLMTVIAASAEPDLQEPKDEFVAHVCRHFAMIFHVEAFSRGSQSASTPGKGGAAPGQEAGGSSGANPVNLGIRGIRTGKQPAPNLKELDPLIFLDALVGVLADDNRRHATAGLQCLNTFAETLLLLARSKSSGANTPRSMPLTPMMVSSPSMNPVLSPPPGVRIPVFEQLVPRLLHCCYGGTWQSHMGGVMGLGALVGKAPVETLCTFQVRAVQALLHVLKRLPQHASKEQEEASQVLSKVLRVANNVDDTNNDQKKQSFQGVLDVLAAELCNPSATQVVRQNVQTCLALLASRNGSEVSELLEGYYTTQLLPLISRPLRNKAVEQQVGTVMALNFCLALQPPLMRINHELIQIFQEALQIAEQDEGGPSNGKYIFPKQLAVRTRLRTVCIELLCTAMARADLKSNPDHGELNTKIIQMFFKSLTCKTPEIVAVAKEGLRQVIQPGKMPKELLQSSLRPILVNLAHWKQLSMPLLQGLARLLEMLSSWFNVTLGDKLMDHLRKWLEPEKLAASTKNWRHGEDAKIAAAIIELFHLLPNAASKFLDPLVTLVIGLEQALPPGQVYSELNSPYRLPLTKYLNKYATTSGLTVVDYFLERLTQPPFFCRLMDIICSSAGQPLREKLGASADRIIAVCFQGTPEGSQEVVVAGMDPLEMQFQGVALVSKLVKLMPDWLASNRPLFDALVRLWRSPGRILRIQNEQNIPFNQIKESKRLVKCFLAFVRKDKSEVDVLFDMMSIFLVRTRIDYTFLKEFLMVEVGETYSLQEKKQVLLRFLQLFQSKALPQDRLVLALQMLIIPMLTNMFDKFKSQSLEVIDKDVVEAIVKQVLDPPEEVSEEYDEQVRIELLQLATLLIKEMPQELQSHRKELIKFGWNHLKREDSVAKQWAFVNVCRFLEAFQAPEKIVLQVFVALLRTCQPEFKSLVKQALDVLMPALPKRLPQTDYRIPIWIRYTKKVLVEEGHSMPHLIHIFQLLVRHQELFYASRGQFVGQMVTSLSRLGLPQNSPTENRRLAVDLAGLVIAWEQRRIEEAKLGPDGPTRPPGPPPEDTTDIPSLKGEKDVFDTETVTAVGLKRTSSAAELPGPGAEGPAKKMKAEGGVGIPMGGPSGSSATTPTGFSSVISGLNTVLQTVGTPGSAGTPGTPGGPSGPPGPPMDEEFRPSTAMEEMIINFLVRIVFLTEQKDKDTTVMYKHSLDLISQALDVWPQTNVKFNYMEKLLSMAAQQAAQAVAAPNQPPTKDATAMLTAGLRAALDVLNRVLEKQPQLFLRSNANQIVQVIEPCFGTWKTDIIQSMCTVLKVVHETFPPEAPSNPPEVAAIYRRLEEQLLKHLGTAKSTPDHRLANNIIGGCQMVLSMLVELDPKNIDRLLVPLVPLVTRQARIMGELFGEGSRRAQVARRNESAEDVQERIMRQGDYAAMAVNLKKNLLLLSKRILAFSEPRRPFFQAMMWLLVDKNTDASVLLATLDIVKEWVENEFKAATPGTPGSAPGNLSAKDVIQFMQRLAQVDRSRLKGDSLQAWDDKFLNLLLKLCTDEKLYPQVVRTEIFQKVERMHMLGLRAKDPELRQKFFVLYHETIGKTLFLRLQHIISGQEWDLLADAFWLKQGLDLLLAILNENEPITLAPNSAQVPPLMAASSSGSERAGAPPTPPPPPYSSQADDDTTDSPPTFQSVVNRHTRFLNEISKLQVVDLILPLRELAHMDAQVAYHMWVLVFPIVWATLQKEEQVTLAKPIITLLSKDYHIKQHDKRPNVVQALLEGISLSQPQPKIPSELIKFLGKSFNAWHIAIPLLESHVMLFPSENRCFDALAELYKTLNEEDVLCGLWRRPASTPEQRVAAPLSRASLSLVQQGMWLGAEDLITRAMSVRDQQPPPMLRSEVVMWEEQWLSCAKKLNQWDLISEFGKGIENYEILLDCMWKMGDWKNLEKLLEKAQVDENLPRVKMLHAYALLHSGGAKLVEETKEVERLLREGEEKIQEGERKVLEGMNAALERWWQLPEIGVQPHIPLLQQFQQLVELQETSKVLQEVENGKLMIAQHNNPGQLQYMELKDILETWRLRVPNDWDDLAPWTDLLQWRMGVFDIIVDAFKGFQQTNETLYHLGFRDKAWSVNRLARVARRHGLPEVCASIINTMYGYPQMEVQEAFVKIREQAKANLDMDSEVFAGLELLKSTSLEYFLSHHKAEIFRLKADFFQRVGEEDQANKSYSTAIALFKHPPRGQSTNGLFKHLPKGWVSWGNFCDDIYTKKQQHDPMWLEYAVSCYMQGVKYGGQQARSYLARVLYLLSFDTCGAVGRAFDKYTECIPYFVWLPWIPQLLLSLQRPEAQHCKAILLKVAVIFPQALYYWLRTYLLERRDVASRAEMQRNQQQQQQLARNQSMATSAVTSLTVDPQGPSPSPSIAHTPPGGEPSPSAPAPHAAVVAAAQVHVGQTGSPAPSVGDVMSVGTPGPETAQPGGEQNAADSATPANAGVDQGAPLRRVSSAVSWPNSAVAAFEAAKEVMEMLRGKHTNLASELEVMLTEVYGRLAPLPEERLLAVVHALLQRCYKYPTATTSEVPVTLRKELGGVCRACFSSDTILKHMDFVNEYKREFERDLDPDNGQTFPTTLAELTERLKHWKGVLQSNVEDRLPAVLKLEEESKPLREFHAVDVEIPGQYFTDQDVAPDHTVKLDRIGADVPIVRRHGSSHRRVTLVGSDGSQHHFLVQTSLTPSARSDERMVQLFRVVNRLLDKHREARRRHLSFHTPIIIPVWPQVRLVEDEVTYSTFGEVYEINCARYGREADLPITHFKERLNMGADRSMTPQDMVEMRLQIYLDITKNFVSENVFSQYMYKTLPTCNHLWTFKKQFSTQLALSAFLSYALHIGGRSPNKILFAKSTGKVFQMDFHPAYDQQGLVECSEAVPFRLTRNLQTFFTPFGVEGLFVASMCAAAQAVIAPKHQHLQHHLAMFFRDELISWSWRRPSGHPSMPNGSGVSAQELKQKVMMNVDTVLARVKAIAPQSIPMADLLAKDEQQLVSCQRGVSELVEAALRPTNLCMMDPTWHPWF